VRELITFTRSIVDTGKMDLRVPVPNTKDELQELILLFNRMLEKIDTLIRGMKDSLDNVAHDLRTPITRLRSTAETALRSGNLEMSREAVADCLEESETVITMLNTLMDISEAETGVLNLQFQSLDLTELIEDMVDFYRYVAEEKNITIDVESSRRIHATVDRNRMRQVIANLLDNAIKYTPDGGMIHVTAEEQGQNFVLNVSDSGIGISEKDLDRVWDRLYRADKSRSQRGLGLGLSFVKAIVLAHHGTTAVQSIPGKGSTFRIQVPLNQPGAAVTV
jgi:signal transduction histidine kinase